MNAKRMHRKIDRTPEELARIKALRARFQGERPTPEQLVACGEYEVPVEHGAVLNMMTCLGLETIREPGFGPCQIRT